MDALNQISTTFVTPTSKLHYINAYTILLVYRPKPSDKNRDSLKEFYSEFTDFVAHYQMYHNKLVITGDFNIHT